MRSAVVCALGLAVAVCGLTACSGGGDPAPLPQVTASDSPIPQVTASDSPVRLVDEDEADLVLYVSNQSFEDDNVRLKLAVDGVVVVDDEFPVEGQHNWIGFPLGLSSGSHSLTAESDSGATLEESFDVPGDEARYAVVNYWASDDSPELTWEFQRDPVAFD